MLEWNTLSETRTGCVLRHQTQQPLEEVTLKSQQWLTPGCSELKNWQWACLFLFMCLLFGRCPSQSCSHWQMGSSHLVWGRPCFIRGARPLARPVAPLGRDGLMGTWLSSREKVHAWSSPCRQAVRYTPLVSPASKQKTAAYALLPGPFRLWLWLTLVLATHRTSPESSPRADVGPSILRGVSSVLPSYMWITGNKRWFHSTHLQKVGKVWDGVATILSLCISI